MYSYKRSFTWSFMPILAVSNYTFVTCINYDKMILDKKFAVFNSILWFTCGAYSMFEIIRAIITLPYLTFQTSIYFLLLFSSLFQYAIIFYNVYKFKNFICIIEGMKVLDLMCQKNGIYLEYNRIRLINWVQVGILMTLSMLALFVCIYRHSNLFLVENSISGLVFFDLLSIIYSCAGTMTSIHLINLLLALSQRLKLLNEYLDKLGERQAFINIIKDRSNFGRIIMVKSCDNLYSDVSLEFNSLKKAYNTLFEVFRHLNAFYSTHVLSYFFLILCLSLHLMNILIETVTDAKNGDLYYFLIVVLLKNFLIINLVIYFVNNYELEVRSTEVLLLRAASKKELISISNKLKRMRMELAHMDTHFDVLRLFNLDANVLIKLFNFGILILITGLDIRKVLKNLSPVVYMNSTDVPADKI